MSKIEICFYWTRHFFKLFLLQVSGAIIPSPVVISKKLIWHWRQIHCVYEEPYRQTWLMLIWRHDQHRETNQSLAPSCFHVVELTCRLVILDLQFSEHVHSLLPFHIAPSTWVDKFLPVCSRSFDCTLEPLVNFSTVDVSGQKWHEGLCYPRSSQQKKSGLQCFKILWIVTFWRQWCSIQGLFNQTQCRRQNWQRQASISINRKHSFLAATYESFPNSPKMRNSRKTEFLNNCPTC